VSRPLALLVVTKGHPYDRSAFMAIFDADRGIEATAVDQPAAQVLLRPENVADYDAVLFYDMSGIALPGSRAGRPGEFLLPPDDYGRSLESLLAKGTGVVLLNHALVSWPAWPLWRGLTGTSFMLRGGELDGRPVPASGFRGGAGELERNATTRLRPATPGHPVLANLEQGFELRDELYLKTRGFESRVVPLLRSDYAFVQENFSASPLASAEEQAAWKHPPGSDLVVWAHAVHRSPVVASELGDGPDAYGNAGFRRLVGNAVRWVASEEARAWASSG
jgi:hypothetical protein